VACIRIDHPQLLGCVRQDDPHPLGIGAIGSTARVVMTPTSCLGAILRRIALACNRRAEARLNWPSSLVSGDLIATRNSSMSRTPRAQDDDAEREDDRAADAMKTQLRRDVASWSKARSESSGRIAEPEAPVAKKPSSRPTTAARKTSAPTTPVAKPAGTSSKPFSMSYDGKTTAEYIQDMIDRGAR